MIMHRSGNAGESHITLLVSGVVSSGRNAAMRGRPTRVSLTETILPELSITCTPATPGSSSTGGSRSRFAW